jgi:hypothetical protein
MGRISGFSNFRCVGYSTVSVGVTQVLLNSINRPSSASNANGACITVIANSAKADNTPVLKFTVPVQPQVVDTGTTPNPTTGTPAWNSDEIDLWPGQLSAKFISVDTLTHTICIQWVILT